MPKYPSLKRSTKAQVCVVGAGISGLTTAYLLAAEGLSVIVLDEGRIGGGQTGRTSAHLASAIDDRFFEIERLHGVESARLAYQSHAAAIDLIERISTEEKIACDFVRLNGYLSCSASESPKVLEKELAAARRVGVKDVELQKHGGLGNARCLRFGNQARFEPMRYLVGLARAVTRMGGRHTGKRVRDGLAFLGRALTDTEEVFVITGDSGMGLTHGTIGAMLITDLIQGRKNSWEKLYDPSRKILNAEFVRENANTLMQYRDLVTSGDVADVKQIRRGQGAVLRKGLKKLAIYRDEAGKLHRHSAVCTHLQCIVHWNSVEKSWDCPCHGSRFDPKGKVLMGPAIDDLPAE